MNAYRIRLEKENFKFSGSHFTIFGPGHAERLHGHNYYVSVELKLESLDSSLGLAFDFNQVKPLVRAITDHLDEYVLLPEKSPHLKIEKLSAENSIRATFGAKRYLLPEEDVRLLPLANISSEELARYLSTELIIQLRSSLPAFASLTSITVGVEETRGQGVFHETDLKSERG